MHKATGIKESIKTLQDNIKQHCNLLMQAHMKT